MHARGGSVGLQPHVCREATRSAKSALDSVERAPVGPVVAVCRHAVLAASFIKMGSDAAYAAYRQYPRGRWEGGKRGKEVSVFDASCPTMPEQENEACSNVNVH